MIVIFSGIIISSIISKEGKTSVPKFNRSMYMTVRRRHQGGGGFSIHCVMVRPQPTVMLRLLVWAPGTVDGDAK